MMEVNPNQVEMEKRFLSAWKAKLGWTKAGRNRMLFLIHSVQADETYGDRVTAYAAALNMMEEHDDEAALYTAYLHTIVDFEDPRPELHKFVSIKDLSDE